MSSASRWSWLAASTVVALMLAVGLGVSGCKPGSDADPNVSAPPDGDDDTSDPGDDDTSDPGDDDTADPGDDDTSDPGDDDTADLGDDDTADPGETIDPGETVDPGDAASSPAAGVSAYAPADDLVAQVENYVERLETAVENEEEYEEMQGRIAKDANTLVVIALGLGLHDQANKHKAAAGTLINAAQDLAGTADYASAKAGVAAVKKAAASEEAAEGELKWEQVASLKQLMEQVPLLNTKLKGAVRRLDRKAADVQGHSAVIAIIAQGTAANADETEKPDQVKQWQAFCVQMRAAAAAVNAGARAQDEDAVDTAMDQLQQSCDDCHAVFHEEEE